MTPMIGQNDVPGERFTIGDAGSVNAFALKRQLGMLSMWSLNRDQTCGLPLPKVSDVVYNTCSGVDQSGKSFSETLWQGTKVPAFPEQSPGSLAGQPAPSGSGSGSASASGAAAGSGSSGASSSSSGASASALPSVTGGPEDAYDSSPYVIWDSAVAYPVNTKVVWHQQVYQAKRWTSGFAPDTQVAKPEDTPWRLLGPVLPGESPAPLPTLPPGTYPQWAPPPSTRRGRGCRSTSCRTRRSGSHKVRSPIPGVAPSRPGPWCPSDGIDRRAGSAAAAHARACGAAGAGGARVSRPRLALLLGVVLLVLGAAAWGLWGLIGGRTTRPPVRATEASRWPEVMVRRVPSDRRALRRPGRAAPPSPATSM